MVQDAHANEITDLAEPARERGVLGGRLSTS